MFEADQEFYRRLARIPTHGLGLSVDVYSPNLFDVLAELNAREIDYGYLEIFKASRSALIEVRRRLPETHLPYHAEGIWLTQPDWDCRQGQREISEVASHLATLGSFWINHECATKQMAGLSFGTYLPPLFTTASAWLTASHAIQFQRALMDSGQFATGQEPLLLLEIPPLTYFAFGDLPVTQFFQSIADQASCGFVLDLGHVWTYYRYSNAWRYGSLDAFFAEFLDTFPLHRVVQIHLAGLAVHESEGAVCSKNPTCPEPRWLDAHHAPIPEVLWSMLGQVLAHPQLHAVKGVALEVDTKSIELIVRELGYAHSRFDDRFNAMWATRSSITMAETAGPESADHMRLIEIPKETVDLLRHDYNQYAGAISGQIKPSNFPLSSFRMEPSHLDLYRYQYLPYEILTWGGNLHEMFPETCRQLAAAGKDVSGFVDFWFQQHQISNESNESYDFFTLKVDRFPVYVRSVFPEAAAIAEQEADVLRNAYTAACETVIS